MEQKTASDSTGFYQFLDLNPGNYRVTVAVQGFRTTDVKGVVVLVDQIVGLDLKLEGSVPLRSSIPMPALTPIKACFCSASWSAAFRFWLPCSSWATLRVTISESVVLGFMAGAGFLVALGQVGNFFGLHDKGNEHQHVLRRLWLTLTQGGAVSPHALEIGAGTVVLVIVLRKLTRRYRLPQIDMLVALIAATGFAVALGWAQPGLTGKGLLSVVGNVPASLPAPSIPHIQDRLDRRDVG